jgi:dienelactone hydrolase
MTGVTRVAALTFLTLLACLASARSEAQERPFHYPVPPLDAVRLTRAVPYARVDSTVLAMDVYRAKTASEATPALILYSMYWPESNDQPARMSNDQALRWARIAAAAGIVAIIPDLRAVPGTGTAPAPARAREGELDSLLAHVTAHAREYGIDANRIALFAASGSVASALPAVQDPRRSAIAAAVLYYGGAGASVTTFRPDLPLFWVRAGRDSPGMNSAIDRLASLALAQNAPLTLVNYATGHHAFEAVDDNATTRAIIRRTLEFVKEATAQKPDPSPREN